MVLLLGAAGCGNDANSGEESEIVVESGSLTRAEFIEKADEICKERKRQFFSEYKTLINEQDEADSSPSDEKQQLVALVDGSLVPVYEKLIEQISALGAPSGDEDKVSAFLNAVRQDLDKAVARPSEAFESLTPFPQAVKQAKAYGLSGCVSSLGA